MELAHIVHLFGHLSEHLGAEHISIYANSLFGLQLTVWTVGATAHTVHRVVRRRRLRKLHVRELRHD